MHHTPRRKFDAYCDFNHNALKKWFAGVRGKKQIHVYHGLYSVRYEEIKPLFRTLFVPTPELNACIEENKRRLGERYVSATLRFQNLMGDFYEGARYKELGGGKRRKTTTLDAVSRWWRTSIVAILNAKYSSQPTRYASLRRHNGSISSTSYPAPLHIYRVHPSPNTPCI